ncbi:MAG TPA: hypothetical protein VI316_06185 [Candidatus Dormibacteraeota bacterium]
MGVLLALVGVGMLSLPRFTRRLLAIIGVRWPEPRHERVAAWLLVVLGLVIALVGRVIT